jgi:hypothetical protein
MRKRKKNEEAERKEVEYERKNKWMEKVKD